MQPQRPLLLLAALGCAACTHDTDRLQREVEGQQRTHAILGDLQIRSMPPPADDSATHPDHGFVGKLTGAWSLHGQIDGRASRQLVFGSWTADGRIQVQASTRVPHEYRAPEYHADIVLRPDAAGGYAVDWSDGLDGVPMHWTGTATADEARDELVFELAGADRRRVRAVWSYRAADDAWSWVIDDVRDGWTTRFATLELARNRP